MEANFGFILDLIKSINQKLWSARSSSDTFSAKSDAQNNNFDDKPKL